LTDRFRASLASRLEEIEGLFDEVREGNGRRAEIENLRMTLHKLAGSAATFGFESVSVASRRAERLLDPVLDGQASYTSEIERRLGAIIEELGNTHSMREASPEQGPVPPTPMREESAMEEREIPTQHSWTSRSRPDPADGTSLVVLLDTSTADFQIDTEALSFLGFDFVRIDSIDDLSPAIDGYRLIVLVVSAELVVNDERLSERVENLNSSSGVTVSLLVVSERDDFDTRLAAIRAGADAFVPLPVEPHRLIDKIEALGIRRSARPFHVLIVDDDPEQVSQAALTLQQAGMITSVASDPRNVFQVLADARPEVILMDMYMPGASGMELSKLIRQQDAYLDIPILFLSVEDDPSKQLPAIRAGADDFLIKPVDPDHLVTAIKTRAERTRNIRFFMERDSLTGLLNHSHLKQAIVNEVGKARRVGRPLAFVMIDLDHFKNVNDTFGHLSGDRVLESLSRLLTDRLRKTDVVGRYGGEEFGIILFNVECEQAKEIVDEIRASFASIEHAVGGKKFSVTLSAGIACYPQDGDAPEISEAADRALYRAKAAGRNQVVVAGE
jgi:diguanylate cyclase (GGDEF)-like protein